MLDVADGEWVPWQPSRKLRSWIYVKNCKWNGHHVRYNFRLARSQKFNSEISFQLRVFV